MRKNKRCFYPFYGKNVMIVGLMDRYKGQTGNKLELSYIDIGVSRTTKGSNTCFLYKLGFVERG